MTLTPRLAITSGISATGKSTTINALTQMLAASFVLEKDAINQGMLHVATASDRRLPDFADYVKGDSVFPAYARTVQTPFGEMFSIDPKNGFYGRHARDQAYVVMAGIAAGNLANGKTPIIDCMVVRQIRDGTVRRFMEQPLFAGYPVDLIHFVADEADCYDRHVARARADPAAEVRDRDKITSRDAFHRFVTEEQPMLPEELRSYEHLVVNTSGKTPQGCARLCLGYILRGI